MGKATWRTKEARYLIWLLCLAGAVAFEEFVPADRAYAASSDLTYSPSSYSTRLLPGQQTTFQLTVTCDKNNITVSCPSVAGAAPSQPIPTSWVSASPTTYTWSKPGTTNFAITISVPAGAAGGSYRSYIRCHVTKGGATDGYGVPDHHNRAQPAGLRVHFLPGKSPGGRPGSVHRPVHRPGRQYRVLGLELRRWWHLVSQEPNAYLCIIWDLHGQPDGHRQ